MTGPSCLQVRRGCNPRHCRRLPRPVVFSFRSRTNHYVNQTNLFPPSITHCSSIREFTRLSKINYPPLLVGMNPCRGCSIRERSQQPSRIFSDEEETPKKLNCSGLVSRRANAHRFHSPVRLSSSRRRDGSRGRTPADSCNHWVSDWITCKDKAAKRALLGTFH